MLYVMCGICIDITDEDDCGEDDDDMDDTSFPSFGSVNDDSMSPHTIDNCAKLGLLSGLNCARNNSHTSPIVLSGNKRRALLLSAIFVAIMLLI